MLSELAQRHNFDPKNNYFSDWLNAISIYADKRKNTLIDLAVDASNLAYSISENKEQLTDPLVISAIQDTSPNFDFSNLPTDQALKGTLNAAKGKYFEYLVADRLNNGGRVGDVVLPNGFKAELAESMNQPGWDIKILDAENRIADYLQLKATDDAAYIRETFDRYPEIRILATSEAVDSTSNNELLLDANMSDQQLEATILDAVEKADTSFSATFVDTLDPLLALVFIAGTEGYRIAIGGSDPGLALIRGAHRGSRTVVSQSVGALIYAAGGGWLSLPAVMMSGLAYERLALLSETNSFVEKSKHQLVLLRIEQQDSRFAFR